MTKDRVDRNGDSTNTRPMTSDESGAGRLNESLGDPMSRRIAAAVSVTLLLVGSISPALPDDLRQVKCKTLVVGEGLFLDQRQLEFPSNDH